jgi:hypothetical protein
MPLDNFDNLVKEVIDYSHRNDLGNKIAMFIQLSENAMYSNGIQPLKVRSMETVSTAATAGQYVELPPDFESARSVRLVLGDSSGELRFQAPEQLFKNPATGKPLFYTIVGNEIQFGRVPDSAYTLEIQYFRKAAPLTTANQTNEILTNHPQIYLFGALAMLFSFAQDTEQEASYAQKFIGAIKGANQADKKGRYGPSPALSLDRGMTP